MTNCPLWWGFGPSHSFVNTHCARLLDDVVHKESTFHPGPCILLEIHHGDRTRYPRLCNVCNLPAASLACAHKLSKAEVNTWTASRDVHRLLDTGSIEIKERMGERHSW